MLNSNRLSALVFVATATLGSAAVAEEVSQDCVNAREVRSMEILNHEAVVLKGTLDRFWLSRLEPGCAGLRKNMQLVVHRYGTKLCANDRFQAGHRIGDGIGPTSSCRFGAFEPIAEGQVAVIKEALEAS